MKKLPIVFVAFLLEERTGVRSPLATLRVRAPLAEELVASRPASARLKAMTRQMGAGVITM